MGDFSLGEQFDAVGQTFDDGMYLSRFEGLKEVSKETFDEDGDSLTKHYLVLEYTIKEDGSKYFGQDIAEMFEITKDSDGNFKNRMAVKLLKSALDDLGIEVVPGGNFSDEEVKGNDFMIHVVKKATKDGTPINNIRRRIAQ